MHERGSKSTNVWFRSYPKLTVPVPASEPYSAIGLAFVFSLHVPFVSGRTIANVIVMFTVPLIPVYAFVPLTIGTAAVAVNAPEQVVVLNAVGLALLRGPGGGCEEFGGLPSAFERYLYKGVCPHRRHEVLLAQIAVESARARVFECGVEVPRTDEATLHRYLQI